MTRMSGTLVASAAFLFLSAGLPTTDDFAECLATLRKAAAAQGIGLATFDSAVAGLEPDSSVVQARRNQPEFTTPVWDYLAALVDSERVADGTARLETWARTLTAVTDSFGVDPYIVTAIWGIESDFGRIMGTRPLIRSLATGACLGTRRPFFRTQFLAALSIVDRGDITADSLVGSWAGAFGQTQFMPTTFLSRAVDGDGDGRRNLIGSVPDALASAANYLKAGGWVSGAPWGYEVRLPANLTLKTSRRTKHSLARWRSAGVRQVDGRPVDGPGPAGLLLPAGRNGPAFLVFRNFDVLYSYNAAETYALAIGHLADRLRGGPPFVTPWPTDDPGISRAGRRELQERLVGLGYQIGTPDGVIGPRTRAAIEAFQVSVGLRPTGRAGGLVLDSLRVRDGAGR